MPDIAWFNERIAATKTAIESYEAAELALTTGGAQSYTIDTGQSRQTVTRSNLTEIRKGVESLYNRLATLESRVFGSTTRVAPLW